MAKVSLYNALTRRVEEVSPTSDGVVGIYACGPTVYDYAHIGNLRAYIFDDTVRRVLEACGYKTKMVVNITDVGHLVSDGDEGDDKLALGAKREKKTAWEVASFFLQAFIDDLDKLNILKPDVMPRATSHIDDQIELIKKIEENGYTYQTSRGVYFDTKKYQNYGKLGLVNTAGQKPGARIGEDSEKKNPADFALWRFSKPSSESTSSEAGEFTSCEAGEFTSSEARRDMEWQSPWGVGFPGWHIECSAMSVKYLGQPFSVHLGGVDHISVHHENEIAQSESATGKPLANIFAHNEHLLVDGKKMSKSLGNYFTLADIIEKGIEPRAFRYLCLQTHYRDKLNFTWQSLKSVQTTLENIDRLVGDQGKEDIDAYKKGLEIVSQDLATPKLLAFLHNENNPWLWIKSKDILGLEFKQKKTELMPEQKDLVTLREEFRIAGDWEKADEIRLALEKQGVVVEDSKLDS